MELNSTEPAETGAHVTLAIKKSPWVIAFVSEQIQPCEIMAAPTLSRMDLQHYVDPTNFIETIKQAL